MSASNITYQSPLASPLLSQTRFASGLKRGELSLLTCHVEISRSVDESIKTAIREMLSQLTIEFSFTSSVTVQSLAIVHPTELTYEQYKLKHELYQASSSSKSAKSSKSDVMSFERPFHADSDKILSNGFIMLTPTEFCNLVKNQTLDRLITQSLNMCKMVHFIVHSLPAYINTEKSCPFRSVNDFVTSITRHWMTYQGRVQFLWQAVDEFAAAKELAAAVRQTCAAESKQAQEAAQFQFGSMRAVKSRTAAMKGARETSKASGRVNRSNDDDSDSDIDGNAEDLDESWRLFLSLVRGVSDDKAVVIARAFPSLRSLLDHYKRVEATGPNGVREAELTLADLRCGNRRIGDAISQRVHKKLWKERSSGQSNAAS